MFKARQFVLPTEGVREMSMKNFQRIDGAAMAGVLASCQGTVNEVILRLGWQAGLTASEMHGLSWSDVDFEGGLIRLPDRSVPMDEEVCACLSERHGQFFAHDPVHVVLTDLRWSHMSRITISKRARAALAEGGLAGVGLLDLRHDFTIRRLEQHPKAYVAKITGLAVATLDMTFLKYADPPYRGKGETPTAPEKPDGEQLLEFILKEGPTPTGLTLWILWRERVMMGEFVALTWDHVDFDAAEIRLEGRQIPMDETLREWLLQVRSARTSGDDPHVLLTPRSRRPFDEPRLSRTIKNALVRAGMDQVTLADFILRGRREDRDALLLNYVATHGYLTRGDAVELLGTEARRTGEQLHRLVEEGRLVRVGKKYCQPGTVVAPDQWYEKIKAHLKDVGGAYRKELADLLQVEPKQCTWILHCFVREGKLEKTKQWYTLPETEGSYTL